MDARILDLAVDALSAYRITRLVTTDRITEPWRERVKEIAGCESLPAYWVTCSWCVGLWSALGIRFVPRPLRRALAVAALVGLIAERE